MLYETLRYVRKRYVLGLILFSSLTYFLAQLFGKAEKVTLLSLDLHSFHVLKEHSIMWSAAHNNDTNSVTIECRNTVHGKFLVGDELGFVCQRSDIMQTGCCNVNRAQTKHYNCDSCNSMQCCKMYEHCVSCCLHPNKQKLLKNLLSTVSARHLGIFGLVKDHFELCLAKCRTDSQSVQNENRYRDAVFKYCYGEYMDL